MTTHTWITRISDAQRPDSGSIRAVAPESAIFAEPAVTSLPLQIFVPRYSFCVHAVVK